MAHEVKLTVKRAGKDEVYSDLVRIPESHRGKIQEGRVCKITVKGGASTRCSIRGMKDEVKPVIRLDETTRNKLKIDVDKDYDFTIGESCWWGQFRWAWNASEPASRLAARLGILSLGLGVLSLVLGVIGLILGFCSLFKSIVPCHNTNLSSPPSSVMAVQTAIHVGLLWNCC